MLVIEDPAVIVSAAVLLSRRHDRHSPGRVPVRTLTVGVLSYDGGVHFGLLADAKLDPGVDVAADALEAALAELTA